MKSIGHGVMQGSILGPILFLILTNNLSSYLSSKIVMYADDVQFLHLESPTKILE
jgi:mannose/fructose/N-acetylgalactosamine-specific phosphotransferase system component IID